MDPETIERLRQSGIRIDREGEFQHEGEAVRHQGLRQALFRWLDRLPDGHFILRLDAERYAYVEVEDTPLVARSARLDEKGVYLGLSDGSEELLEPRSLRVDRSGIVRCLVRNGRLPARLATSAVAALSSAISETPAGPVIHVGGRVYALAEE